MLAARIPDQPQAFGRNVFNGRVQKLRTCEICASYLSTNESDAHLLEGHFMGKLHIGYKEIREKFEELKVCFVQISALFCL
jgi:hypothetical protein